MQPSDTPRRGRGAISIRAALFVDARRRVGDGGMRSKSCRRSETVMRADPARSIIARNNSPDLPFSQSINPYRGCEHGCVSCYAVHRLSRSLARSRFRDEALLRKTAELLTRELAHPGYVCRAITIGASDPYRPVERRQGVTRSLIRKSGARDTRSASSPGRIVAARSRPARGDGEEPARGRAGQHRRSTATTKHHPGSRAPHRPRNALQIVRALADAERAGRRARRASHSH